MAKRMAKRTAALTAALAITVSGITVNGSKEAQAASKKAPTLSVSSVTLKKGQTKKIKINANKQKITKVTWKVDKKKLKITKKTKKYAVVKALKTGNASISVTIKTTKKTYTRTVKAKIKATKKATPKPKTTKAPVNSPAPSAPAVSGEPSGSGAPTVTTPSSNTAEPANTNTPDESKAPDESAEPAASDAPSVSSQPSTSQTPSKPGIYTPVYEFTAEKAWNGYEPNTTAFRLRNLSPFNAGNKYRYSVKVKLIGSNPTDFSYTTLKIKSDYNGYPLLAEVNANDAYNSWVEVTFEHRFAEFTSPNPCLFFNDAPNGISVMYKEFSEVMIEKDDGLGGTPLTPASWHKGSLTSLRDSNINKAEPNKAYENKSVHISFKVRAKGEIPDGSTCYIKANGITPNRVIEDIPLTADWHSVEADCNFGAVSDNWPGLFFDGEDITSDMELFVKDVSLVITGDAPVPTAAPTAVPGETDTIAVNKSVTINAGTEAYKGFKNVLLDSTISIKTTDTVKAKLKVCFDGETEEQTSYTMQFGFYTGDNDWGTRCFMTDGLVSGTAKELDKNEAGTQDTQPLSEDKTVKGFKIQNQQAIPAGKDLVVTLVELQITHSADAPTETNAPDSSETPAATATATATATAAPTEEPVAEAQDMTISLKQENTTTLKETGRTLTVTDGVASLTGIDSSNDGFAIMVELPNGVKLQDYASVKLSMSASKAVYSKNIHICVNEWDTTKPNEDSSSGDVYDLSYQTKIGELTGINVSTTAANYEVPLDFSNYSKGDIKGTVCLMIGLNGNDGNESSYGASGINLSNISLRTPRTETSIELTNDNTAAIFSESTCTVTGGKAALTCSKTDDGIVIQLPIESGKKLQDYKGISFTFTSELASDKYGKNVTVAVNKWNTSSPNVDSTSGERLGIDGQTKIAQESGTTIKTGDNTYKLDFDFSKCDQGDITGTIALMIGMSYNNKHEMNWSVSNVKLLS